jgi:hypothetical protein
MRVAAATLRVERDGSGDFTAIQPALDAAASGDTVLIGPGEFTEYSMVRLDGYAWDVAVFAYSELPSLTIIGSGVDQTIIGPTVPMRDYSTYSAKCLVWVNGVELHLRGLTMRNCYDGLHVPQGSIDVEDCSFLEHAYGILWQAVGVGGRLQRIEFRTSAVQPHAVFIQGAANGVTIADVVSTNGGKFYFIGAHGVALVRCDVAGGTTGVSCHSGSTVTIRDSHLHGASNQQLYVYDASCDVDNSVLEGGDGAIYLSSYSSVSVVGSVLSGAFAAIASGGGENLAVHGSHVLRAGQWSVWANGPTTGGHRTYDLTNNYWGTTDAADIAAWIWDSRDSTSNWATVLYEPFSSQEVPTESTTWGDLKAAFR